MPNIPLVLAPVILACERNFDAHKNDCSGFVKAVAGDLRVLLTGQANDIVDQIQRVPWKVLADGPAAELKAETGAFVVAGLKDNPHGHVVVITPGPLASGKYPVAYWGKLGGAGKKKTTINWAWDEDHRDHVIYGFVNLR